VSTAPASAPTLRAVTRAIDNPKDLLDGLGPDGFAWLHDGVGLVTAGCAARVSVELAAVTLASIDHEDDCGWSGSGPLAVGALPFDNDEAAEVILPARIMGRTGDGRSWITELGEPWQISPPAPDYPDVFTVRELTSRTAWNEAIEQILAKIAKGTLEKMVLARQVEIVADRPFDHRTVLDRLRIQQPGCFIYAANGFVGASPELLVRRRGDQIESAPMAGTVAGTDADAVEFLRQSPKDAREHALVVSAILAGLTPYCEHLDAATEPEVAVLATIAHLVTPITGQLFLPAPDALTLARALHPTPAVGGTPVDAARRLITQLEGPTRGCYAGPVGWVDSRGDGEWALALRGAKIDGPRALLHAGAGIVTGSDPETEWHETEAKFESMIRALVRP